MPANPLLPLSIFRIKGLAAADITQLVGIAGMFAVFFFLTLYLQEILGYSPIRTGLAYLPVTAAPVALDAGFHRALLTASIFLLAAALVALQQPGDPFRPGAFER